MSTVLRRAPQQARGRRRIDAILDAAEQVLAEAGYEGATTNAIAARADTSIGSLYQFFPNKDAIMQALGLRYIDRCRDAFTPLLSPAAADLPMNVWIDRIVDALDSTEKANAGFKELFSSAATTPDLAAADNAMHHQFIVGLDSALAERMPHLDPERRLVCAEVGVRTAEAIMPLLAESPGARRALVLAELKVLLAAYMQRTLDEEPQAEPNRQD
ncbi:MAG TPA: TetR/AcrR family transcriptional regulator [Chloroflexota bacterium]|nr:TetR/AcrR family transcriptional regulator [Chloroflexota bacterium]